MSDYVPTLQLMRAVEATITALQLAAPHSGPAFTEVHVYTRQGLLQAMRDLLIKDERVCIIVPTGNTYENKREGRIATSRRTSEITLLITDKVYGGSFDAEALTGNDDTPGIAVLQDLVVTTLQGQSLNLPGGVCLEPGGGEPITLGDPKKGDKNRECWAQPFSTPAGERRVDRSRAGLLDASAGTP